MVFMCQNDSYLKEFKTKVKSCEKSTKSINGNKKDKVDGFDVELEDTILFPQGGGQPYDQGTIDDVQVLQVTRNGAKAIHFVCEELEVGKEVELKVDWMRRFDHMQQHSGQHLITAIADEHFGFKTTSWDMGKKTSFIEMDTPAISQQQLQEIERIANEYVRNQTPVIVHTYPSVKEIPPEATTRGLPLDHVGEIRTIEIKDVDCNMCCGTHVSNLSHLQIIKLLQVEKGKKGKSNLFFLVGDRVGNFVQERWNMDKDITKSLKCGPDQYVESVERTVKQLKLSQRNETKILREIAVMEAEKVENEFKQEGKRFFHWHRKEGNNEYMNSIAKNTSSEIYLFLTVGDEKGAGMFLLRGSEELVSNVGSKIDEIIDGRGPVKGNMKQGKANNLKKMKNVIECLQNEISKTQ